MTDLKKLAEDFATAQWPPESARWHHSRGAYLAGARAALIAVDALADDWTRPSRAREAQTCARDIRKSIRSLLPEVST